MHAFIFISLITSGVYNVFTFFLLNFRLLPLNWQFLTFYYQSDDCVTMNSSNMYTACIRNTWSSAFHLSHSV